MLWVLGWRSKHPYHGTSQARNCVSGYLGWVSLKCTRPKKDAVGSGVALQTRIPWHFTSQKRCFWIPRMGAFGMHNGQKRCFGVWGLGPKNGYHGTAQARNCVSGYLGWVSLKCRMPKKYFVGSGVALQNTHNMALHKPETVFLDT